MAVGSTRDYVSRSAEETVDIGQALGRRLRGGEVLLMFGPVGAGKTEFVRGLTAGLGLDADQVSSPSYALINEYPGRLTLYHVDLYRLATVDLPDLGLEELFGADRVVAIEWAERLEEAGWDLGSSILVEIDYDRDQPGARVITVDEAWPPEPS